MFRKLFTMLLLMLVGLSMSLFGRDIKEAKVHKLTLQEEANWTENLKNLGAYTPAPVNNKRGQVELGRTFYDYATNNQMGRMVAQSANGIHFAFMKILPDGAERHVTYDYFDNAGALFFGNQSVDESLGRTGWGRVFNGKNDEALVTFHGSGIHLYSDVSEAGYTFSSKLSVTEFAAFVNATRNGDTVIFLTYRDNDSLFVSTDYMATWTSGNPFQFKDSLVTDDGTSETPPSINPTNTSEFSYVLVPDATVLDPNGSTIMITSSDLGSSFTTTRISGDDDTFINGADSLTYIIENFGQVNSMYSSNGNFNVVIGAVQGFDQNSAIIDRFPILYWNSSAQEFVRVSSEAASHPADTTTATNLAGFRPGNGLGNAYPHIAEGPSGELVMVWQQWEDDGAGGLVTVVGAGGAEVFMTDIWASTSGDGGATWSEPLWIAGTPGESDVFPNLPENLRENATGDSLIVDLLYFNDTNPGVSLFTGGNDPSEGIWYYERVAIERPVTGIEDASTVKIGDFALAQNYPNPFNPSTKIEYSLKKASDVTLEIYNVVGQKVAVLVNERKPAGLYEVNFDASNLSSGLYFYTLKSGDVNLTRKMMLLK